LRTDDDVATTNKSLAKSGTGTSHGIFMFMRDNLVVHDIWLPSKLTIFITDQDVLYVILTRISRGFCISGQKFEIQFVATVMAIFV
jgi:hypothetical protein